MEIRFKDLSFSMKVLAVFGWIAMGYCTVLFFLGAIFAMLGLY